eukprot:9257561-Alexandrium_andersonii.AAC.1
MSASLVGSEMCIRDRSSSRAPCRGGPRAAPTRRAAESCPCTGARRHEAVSYTHLTLPTICSV